MLLVVEIDSLIWIKEYNLIIRILLRNVYLRNSLILDKVASWCLFRDEIDNLGDDDI